MQPGEGAEKGVVTEGLLWVQSPTHSLCPVCSSFQELWAGKREGTQDMIFKYNPQEWRSPSKVEQGYDGTKSAHKSWPHPKQRASKTRIPGLQGGLFRKPSAGVFKPGPQTQIPTRTWLRVFYILYVLTIPFSWHNDLHSY